MAAGWTRRENFVSDKTKQAFDFEIIKNSRAKTVTRLHEQDESRLKRELQTFSRDFQKKMNKLSNETRVWQEKAKQLRESRDSMDVEQGVSVPSSAVPVPMRRKSMPADALNHQMSFLRQRSKTVIDVQDLTGLHGSKMPLPSRRQSLAPASLTQKQIDFFAKIANKSKQNKHEKLTQDNVEKTVGASEDVTMETNINTGPQKLRSRSGRRGSLPAMHLSVSRPSKLSLLSPLELIEELSTKQDESGNEISEEESPAEEDKAKMDTDEGGNNTSEPEVKIPVRKTSTSKPIVIARQNSIKKTIRFQSESGSESKESILQDNGRKQNMSPRLPRSHDHDDDIISLVCVASQHAAAGLSRSNSLYSPRNFRLTRRRQAETVHDDAEQENDLAEQFRKLQNCRYLRTRSQSESEECDISTVFQ